MTGLACARSENSVLGSVLVFLFTWPRNYSWVPKNWCFSTVVLEKTPESPLDCKEIQPVHPKGNQSWIFIGRTDAEVETPILWPPDVKDLLICKDPDPGRRRRGRQRMRWLRWHHQLDGHKFEQAPGDGDGQGSLTRCNPWGHVGHDLAITTTTHKESDILEM